MSLLESRIFGPKLRSSHARVVEALGNAIVAGDIPVGAILPGDHELMARFDVSRTVLREAMKTLAAKQLVAAKARVGTSVRPREEWNFVDGDVIGWRLRAGVDPEFVEHLTEMRLALEPTTAALAARRATAEEILVVYRLAAAMERLDHSRESIAQADLDFHLEIARLSRNAFMRSVSSLIEAALAVSFHLSSPALSPGGIAECAASHLRIAHAIATRDEDLAAEAMRNVILTGAERIRLAFAAQAEAPSAGRR